MAPQRAWADALPDLTLFQGTTLVYGQQSDVYSLNDPGPGTLEIVLQDMAWPEPLQDISLSLVNANGTLGTMSGPGDLDILNTKGGPFAAYVTSLAGNTLGLNLGLYSLKIEYVPLGSPVPLPAAIFLLLSGMGVLGAVKFLGSRDIRNLAPQGALCSA
jgi:hypothetical protein